METFDASPPPALEPWLNDNQYYVGSMGLRVVGSKQAFSSFSCRFMVRRLMTIILSWTKNSSNQLIAGCLPHNYLHAEIY